MQCLAAWGVVVKSQGYRDITALDGRASRDWGAKGWGRATGEGGQLTIHLKPDGKQGGEFFLEKRGCKKNVGGVKSGIGESR